MAFDCWTFTIDGHDVIADQPLMAIIASYAKSGATVTWCFDANMLCTEERPCGECTMFPGDVWFGPRTKPRCHADRAIPREQLTAMLDAMKESA